MEIDKVQNIEPRQQNLNDELKIQNNLQKEVQKEVDTEKVETTPLSSQKQVMQIINSAQPLDAIQKTAQEQLDKDKGFDVKV